MKMIYTISQEKFLKFATRHACSHPSQVAAFLDVFEGYADGEMHPGDGPKTVETIAPSEHHKLWKDHKKLVKRVESMEAYNDLTNKNAEAAAKIWELEKRVAELENELWHEKSGGRDD